MEIPLSLLDAISCHMVLNLTVKTVPLLDRELLKKTGIMGLATGQLVVFVGGGWWLGAWLDRKYHSAPVLTAVLAMLGLSYAGWRIWRLAKEWMK